VRAPFQILAIPYRFDGVDVMFAALKRSDDGYWQGVAGGGDLGETPLQAAIRECYEEVGVGSQSKVLSLKSQASVSVEHFSARSQWPVDLFVIPEYCFALNCTGEELLLSDEHTDLQWGNYESIKAILHWDSNKTALWELHCRLSRSN